MRFGTYTLINTAFPAIQIQPAHRTTIISTSAHIPKFTENISNPTAYLPLNTSQARREI
jgi:hypothetical protein